MLAITQITQNLDPFQGHTTILWGNGNTCGLFLPLMRKNNINIQAICDPDWNHPTHREGIQVIPPSSLHQLGDVQSFVIQIVLDSPDQEKETMALLLEVGYFAVISAQETWSILHFMTELDDNFKNPQNIQHEYVQSQQDIKEELKLLNFSHTRLDQDLLILCMPPKTADHTIINTLQQHQIPHHFVFHRPEAIPLELLRDSHPKIKIITAVREPIAENISLCFQILGDLQNSMTARYLLAGKYSRNFFEHGGNLQEFFELFLKGIHDPHLCGSHSIQRFIPAFQNKILDYLSFPFEQEKGYSVCEQDNISVFVYQLEKLDHLLPELSEFLGKTIPAFTMGNVATDKWIGKTYQQAQKELKISETYWNDAYSSPWVKHFYSSKDIKTFQDKWRKNIY